MSKLYVELYCVCNMLSRSIRVALTQLIV